MGESGVRERWGGIRSGVKRVSVTRGAVSMGSGREGVKCEKARVWKKRHGSVREFQRAYRKNFNLTHGVKGYRIFL